MSSELEKITTEQDLISWMFSQLMETEKIAMDSSMRFKPRMETLQKHKKELFSLKKQMRADGREITVSYINKVVYHINNKQKYLELNGYLREKKEDEERSEKEATMKRKIAILRMEKLKKQQQEAQKKRKEEEEEEKRKQQQLLIFNTSIRHGLNPFEKETPPEPVAAEPSPFTFGMDIDIDYLSKRGIFSGEEPLLPHSKIASSESSLFSSKSIPVPVPKSSSTSKYNFGGRFEKPTCSVFV